MYLGFKITIWSFEMCTGNMFLSGKWWYIIDFMTTFYSYNKGAYATIIYCFFSLRALTNNLLEQSIITIWKQYRKPFHYCDSIILTRHSQPQSIFHFLLMWEVFLKFRGFKEALQRCLRTGNSATKQSGIIFSTNSTLQIFL